MSTYPTTATLAAFRRSIGTIADPWSDRPRYYGPTATVIHTLVSASPVSGAWSDELQHGIGAHDRDTIPCPVPGHVGGIACGVEAGDRAARNRREASVMRSRAYAAADNAHSMDDIAWNATVRTFCPYTDVLARFRS